MVGSQAPRVYLMKHLDWIFHTRHPNLKILLEQRSLYL